MSEIEVLPVVVDSGSGSFKVGLAGNADPLVFPPVVGRSKGSTLYQRFSWMFGCSYKDTYVGGEAQRNRDMLNINWPIQHGMIINWDDYEKVWNYLYEEVLLLPSEERPLLLTEAPFNSLAQRENMAEILFEKLRIPSLGLTLSAMLSLHATGRTSGVVLDSGEAVTYIVPIYEGAAFPHAILRCPQLAGADLTEYLSKLLIEREPSFARADRSITREIKEQHCYVALNPAKELANPQSLKTSYQLPDGKRIALGSARFRCPEALFHPSLLGNDCRGIHQGLYDSIMKCREKYHEAMYTNVILTGGTTLLPGLAERVQKELVDLLTFSSVPTVIEAPYRPYSAWLGGSLLACMSNFQNMCISKQDYDEQGSGIMHRVMGPI